jgi:NAD(P)-dependent dehydrogenase (short-subunit alcohol dehydrogenase family)
MRLPSHADTRTIIPAAAAAAALLILTSRLRRRADLRDDVALVTGGSRGLGLVIARELIDAGCRVAICARDEHGLRAAERELADRGGDVLAIPCDVGDAAAVGALVSSIERHFGHIDLLINNAGIIQVGPLASMRASDFHETMRINFGGMLNTVLAVLPGMRARRSGRIVNITSIGGAVAVPHLLPYVCAKFAARGLSEGLRAELAGTGISVTTVLPGLMRTGSAVNALFKGDRAKEFAWFALGSATPVTAMSARRAARRIVRAAARG